MSSISSNRYFIPIESKKSFYGPAKSKKLLKENRCSLMKWKVVYHGTSQENALSLRNKGFCLNKKTHGATKRLNDLTNILDSNHTNFHYVTTSPREAASYAKIYKNPEILSIICKSKILKLDHASANEKTALCFQGKLDKNHILNKNPEVLSQNEWQQFFANIGVSEKYQEKIKNSIPTSQETQRLLERTESAISSTCKQLKKVEGLALRLSPAAEFLRAGESVEVSLSLEDLESLND
jgi:hypothetical protein